MRLTKTIRKAFVRAAMDDVPSIDYQEMARQLVVKTIDETMPECIKSAVTNPIIAPWIHMGTIDMPYPLRDIMYYNKGIYLIIEKEHPLVWDALKKLSEKEREQDAARESLRQKLRAAAESVQTRKALVALLPEFEKYLPAAIEEAKNLPAVANLVADFVTAGWPKAA